MWAYATSYDAIVLENASTTVNYGNSHFGLVAAVGIGHSGLVMRTTDTAQYTFKTLGMIDFDNFESNGSTNGIYTQGAQFITFKFVDLEANQNCLNFGCQDLSHQNSRHISVLDGYLLPSSGGTTIQGSVGAGGIYVRAYVQQSASEVLISDPMQYLPRNQYDLRVGSSAVAATRSITSDKQIVRISGDDDSMVDNYPAGMTLNNVPVATTTDTQTLTNKTLTSPVINTPTGIVKGDVGLGNVDNTADTNKPVSTATQTALAGRVTVVTYAGDLNAARPSVDAALPI